MRHAVACATGWFLATALCAGEPTSAGGPFPVEEARRLVREMGDNDVKKREAAFDALLHLAESQPKAVLALLPEPGNQEKGDVDFLESCDTLRQRCIKFEGLLERLSGIDPRLPPLMRDDPAFAEAAAALLPLPETGTLFQLWRVAGKTGRIDLAAEIMASLLDRDFPVDTLSAILSVIGLMNVEFVPRDVIYGRKLPGEPTQIEGTVEPQRLEPLGEGTRRRAIARIAPFLEHPNDQMRCVAARVLCLLDAKEHAAAILKRIPETRSYMNTFKGDEIARLGPELALPALLGYLKDGNYWARSIAARAIGYMMPGKAELFRHVEPLLEDSCGTVRLSACNAVIQLLGTEKALPLLAGRMADDASGTVISTDGSGLNWWFTGNPSEALHHALARWFGDPRPRVRLRAMAMLGERMSCSHVVRAIEGLLGDPDMSVRVQAILRLGRVGDRSSVPKLAPFLYDTDPYIQVQAGISIGLLVDGFWVEAKTNPNWAVGRKWTNAERTAKKIELEMTYKDSARHAREWWETNKDRFAGDGDEGEGEKSVKGRRQ